MTRARLTAVCLAILALAPIPVGAQTPANLAALSGLAAAAALPGSAAGKAALDANYAVTGAIQTGALQLPMLLPFPEQQGLALKDAFITGRNAAELADGLGSRLGAVYQAHAGYQSPTVFTSISPAVASLIAATGGVTSADSNAAKYFLANGTIDGKTPASVEAAAILTGNDGVTDVYGKAYGHRAGSPGADIYGNSRPFQTEPSLTVFTGEDYFGNLSDNVAFLRGPAQNLTDSPAYPSGHTTYGYAEAVLLGILVPARYQQEITRAAEYGNDRIILGAHYAMDVIGGRALALHDLAHLLAEDPAYRAKSQAAAYPALLATARAELTAVLEAGCGVPIAVCAATDSGRFADPVRNGIFVAATLTYGLPVVHANTAEAVEDVAKTAPEAGHLLTAAFPGLTVEQADAILTDTEGPGGGFLDDGSAFGVYSRLNLYAAAGKAAALVAGR